MTSQTDGMKTKNEKSDIKSNIWLDIAKSTKNDRDTI